MFIVMVVAMHVLRAQDAQIPSFETALKYEGRPVASIAFDPLEQPVPVSELEGLITLKAGVPFHERALEDSIQKLYSTGRFSDLAVDADAAGNGVALRFVTRSAYFIGRVEVRGVREPPNSGQLASATKLALGTPYAESAKTQAVELLQILLRQNGLYNASIDTRVAYDRSVSQANLTFTVNPGARARFEKPDVTGTPDQPVAAVIRYTRWQRLYGLPGWQLLGWQQVTQQRVQQGLDGVRRWYQKRERLRSRVTLTNLDYHSETNTVKPILNVIAGNHIRLTVRGARISKGKLHQLVPVFQERSIDRDLLVEGQRNIQQALVADGYFGATVTLESSEGANQRERVVTFDVDRGPRHKFVRLAISGNHYFQLKTIKERLYIEPASFPRFPYGRFSEVYLQQDTQTIRDLYESNGFRAVRVTARTQDNYLGKRDQLVAFITIVEGSQSRVADLRIEGVPSSRLPSLRSLLALAEGQPFSQSSVASDRENLLNQFYNDGYPNAAFEYSVEPAAAPEAVNVRYVLTLGQRKFVRDLVITGLDTTRPALVRNRIEIDKDAPLSLSKNTESERRLYDLGIFARVNTALQNPEGDEDKKNVLYDLEEARHYSLNLGVGAQIARIGGGVTTLDNPAGTTGFSPRATLGLSRINFLGLGQTISLQSAVSTIEQRASLTYFIPEFAYHQNLSLTSTGLFDNSNGIRTFTAHRREGSVQLGQKLSRAYTVQYRLLFRRVTQGNLKIQQLLVPLLSQPERVGLAEVTLIQDKRDDPTDAHRGIYTTLDAGYAPKALLSQTSFSRFLLRNSTYTQITRNLVFARSTQLGVISRTGGRVQIPLAERFYSGGSTSIRAFPDFQAGPRDLETGFPLGGNALLLNNFELRFPLYGDNVGGVLFHDAGNVYSSLGNMSLRFRQRDLQDFDYMVQSVGFGIRYRTPIGPVRLDLSFSPDAPRFFGLKGSEQDFLNGTASSRVQKINAFQFHFSLGQAF